MITIGTYIVNCIYIGIIVLISDTIFRVFESIYEYICFPKRYLPEERVLLILKRVFSYNVPTMVSVVVMLLAALLNFGITQRSPVPPATHFLYMPLYWMYRIVHFDYNLLQYANWIRHNHGLDYGEGMALSYYHGYLNLTMPSHNAQGEGVEERIRKYSDKQGVTFAINRLVVLIPSNFHIEPVIKSEILERAAPLETLIKDRAGNSRPYKNDVYRFTKRINGTYYYIALEGATPLLTFLEAMRSNATSTWQMKEMKREILFKFYFSLKRIIRVAPETERAIELVFYNAKKVDGSEQDVGEVLIAHFENLWAKKNL